MGEGGKGGRGEMYGWVGSLVGEEGETGDLIPSSSGELSSSLTSCS